MPVTTSTIDSLSWDGPLPWTGVVALGGLFLALIVWSLRRELHVLGRSRTLLFGVLRTVATLLALWMLLAPALVRTEKSTTRRAVAIVVDASESMSTTDPPAPDEDWRWMVAAEGADATSPTALADRAMAATTLAVQRLHDANAALRSQKPERLALLSAAAAWDAVERASANLQALAQRAKNSADKNGTWEPIPRMLEILQGTDCQRLGELAAGVRRGQDSLQVGWREQLADLEYRLAGIERRMAELVRQVAVWERSSSETTQHRAALAGRPARSARVGKLVTALDESVLAKVHSQADVRHAEFDSFFRSRDSVAAASPLAAANAADPQPPSKLEGPAPVGPPATNLTEALDQLRQLRQEQPLAAVLLFTDAAHNQSDVRDPRDAAAELAGTPVYVVPIGNPEHVRDVELKAISAPGVVMKDDDVVIEATVQAYDCATESVLVELLQDGRIVQDRQMTIDSDIATLRARFHARLDEVGLQRFQVRVGALDAERSTENNFDQFEVQVTRDHIDLLLADELPRWEFRYLAQLFRRDAKVACDELLFHPRLSATGKRAESKTFPTTADEWDEYDVVLMGDVSSEHLTVEAQTSLAEYLQERGGTLVVIAGDESMPHAFRNQPLEELLPVTHVNTTDENSPRDGYALQVTSDGWQHHALMIADTQDGTRTAWDFINAHAPLYALSPYRQARPTARTLITALPRPVVESDPDPASRAFLCWQPVGRGRVVYLASPETYRLRFLRGDRLHYRFWGQLLRWAIASDLATGSELVTIRTDRPDYRFGERANVAVRLMDETGRPVAGAELEAVAIGDDEVAMVVPLAPDGSAPGRYTGTFERLPPGVYRLEPRGAEVERLLANKQGDAKESLDVAASFTIRSALNRELLDTRSDRALAQQIAAATGGQVLPPTAIGEVLGLTQLEPLIDESQEMRPLWVRWEFLVVIFGCLFVEWGVRKQLGLS